MKRPIILLFPIVTELLLYASGVPLQQNRGDSFASHSASSDTFTIVSTPAQPSDLDHVLDVLHPRASVNSLLNPAPETAPGAPTSSTSHPGGSDIILPPIHSIISPQGVPPPGIFPAPRSQVPSRHGAQAGRALAAAVPPHSAADPHQPYASQPVSSSPQPEPGDSSALDDLDRLPKDMPPSFSSFNANHVAVMLEEKIGGKTSTPEVVEEVINGMVIIKTLFQRALQQNRPTAPDSLLRTWRQKIDELSKPHAILTESELRLVEGWKLVMHRQMRAIAKLYQNKDRQLEWDRQSWNDISGSSTRSSTTQLKRDRETSRFLDFLRIMGHKFPTHGPINRLWSLISTPQKYEYLLELATKEGGSHDSNDINNVLVIRRKAIQMWMLEGMTKEEFVEQKRILREIVAKLEERDLNKVRAEMVIISLQRFFEAENIQWKEQ
ncbi:hypothetical protein H0H93_011158 [Arthromyces matolae]|nr:hypothetical protein H0H93_011158 [Arthromyces matolae]